MSRGHLSASNDSVTLAIDEADGWLRLNGANLSGLTTALAQATDFVKAAQEGQLGYTGNAPLTAQASGRVALSVTETTLNVELALAKVAGSVIDGSIALATVTPNAGITGLRTSTPEVLANGDELELAVRVGLLAAFTGKVTLTFHDLALEAFGDQALGAQSVSDAVAAAGFQGSGGGV